MFRVLGVYNFESGSESQNTKSDLTKEKIVSVEIIITQISRQKRLSFSQEVSQKNPCSDF